MLELRVPRAQQQVVGHPRKRDAQPLERLPTKARGMPRVCGRRAAGRRTEVGSCRRRARECMPAREYMRAGAGRRRIEGRWRRAACGGARVAAAVASVGWSVGRQRAATRGACLLHLVDRGHLLARVLGDRLRRNLGRRGAARAAATATEQRHAARTERRRVAGAERRAARCGRQREAGGGRGRCTGRPGSEPGLPEANGGVGGR
eukprot:5721113-Prymnesium_polylepis.1